MTVRFLFTDIDYADDAVLRSEDDVNWPSIIKSFDTTANTMGLHAAWADKNSKSKRCLRTLTAFLCHIRTSSGSSHRFTYLGSDVDSSCYCTLEILRIG